VVVGGMSDGAHLLDELHTAVTRYVVLPTPEAADAVVLWIAASHAQPAWEHAPRLAAVSPEKRCGKSRLMDVVDATCHRPLITVNATVAAVFRSIGDDPPTLLVDEADTIFGTKRQAEHNEDLRGLLNAGHQRNRPALRVVGVGTAQHVQKFNTFAMAMLASIGALPDTIMDRAIVVRMRRRALHEKVNPSVAAATPHPCTTSGTSWPPGSATTWTSSLTPTRPCRWRIGRPTPGRRWSLSPTWPALTGPPGPARRWWSESRRPRKTTVKHPSACSCWPTSR
jgi:hypothetical protein